MKGVVKIPAVHISFKLSEPLVLPVNYSHLLQAFIYQLLPKRDANFLHDHGYSHGKRSFKGFTYSRIMGRPRFHSKDKTLTFRDEISLSIASFSHQFIEEIANNLLLAGEVSLHHTPLTVREISYDDHEINRDQIIVQAISPITVHQTFETRTGEKITHYFTPFDHLFSHLLEDNFARKFEALYDIKLPQKSLIRVKPLNVTNRDKVLTSYKGFWIEGWLGKYEVYGKAEYLSFILSTGLGSRNSMGHGMIRLDTQST